MKMGKKYWKDALGLFPAAMVVPPTNNQKSQNSNNENKTVANISDPEFKTMNNSNPSITKNTSKCAIHIKIRYILTKLQ